MKEISSVNMQAVSQKSVTAMCIDSIECETFNAERLFHILVFDRAWLYSLRKNAKVGARSVRARLVGQGFNPDCRTCNKMKAGFSPCGMLFGLFT
jgi:hypothetical protein